MLLSTPLSALSDHVDRRSLRVGVGGVALLFAAFGLLRRLPQPPLCCSWAMPSSLPPPRGRKALIAELAPQAQVGTAFGWFHLVSGVMLLPASALFGWLWTHAGSTAAFMASATTSLIAAGLLLRDRQANR